MTMVDQNIVYPRVHNESDNRPQAPPQAKPFPTVQNLSFEESNDIEPEAGLFTHVGGGGAEKLRRIKRDNQRLQFHQEEYLRNCRKMEEERARVGQIAEVESYFRDNKIKILKLNHCFKEDGFTQYEGYLQLMSDNNQLKIFTKVPNPKYRVIQNSKELDYEQKKYADQLKAKLEEYNRDKGTDLTVEAQGKETEFENEDFMDFQLNTMKDYTLKESKSSFCISDVQNFVYGPFTSRFWMLRKHFMHIDGNSQQLQNFAFYAWDCLTIQINGKWDIHLIV